LKAGNEEQEYTIMNTLVVSCIPNNSALTLRCTLFDLFPLRNKFG